MTRLLSVLGVVAAAGALVVTAVLASAAPSAPRDVQDLLPAAAAVQLPDIDAGADPATPASAAASTTSREPDPAWVTSTATATGVPARALQAYASATLRAGAELPGCRLGWTTLAGIGHVESAHGGSALAPDGRTSVEGPALDGTSGYAAISEGGTWDRARGPLQFIASTWRQWGSDGDGDGVADVDDVDDAAWTAARYLCASGADLTTPAGWTAAVHSYNHSDVYVRSVLAAADAYAARSGG